MSVRVLEALRLRRSADGVARASCEIPCEIVSILLKRSVGEAAWVRESNPA
jgi:hypothetical protein